MINCGAALKALRPLMALRPLRQRRNNLLFLQFSVSYQATLGLPVPPASLSSVQGLPQ